MKSLTQKENNGFNKMSDLKKTVRIVRLQMIIKRIKKAEYS